MAEGLRSSYNCSGSFFIHLSFSWLFTFFTAFFCKIVKHQFFQCHFIAHTSFFIDDFFFQILKTGDLLVGSGGGAVALVKGAGDKYGLVKPAKKVQGAVTSIALRGEGHQFFVGTNKAEILRFVVEGCKFTAVTLLTLCMTTFLCAAFTLSYVVQSFRYSRTRLNRQHGSTDKLCLVRALSPSFQCIFTSFKQQFFMV